jgi:hypothetical protein
LEHESNPISTSGDSYALKFAYSLSYVGTSTPDCAITNIPVCSGLGCTTPNTVCHA